MAFKTSSHCYKIMKFLNPIYSNILHHVIKYRAREIAFYITIKKVIALYTKLKNSQQRTIKSDYMYTSDTKRHLQ